MKKYLFTWTALVLWACQGPQNNSEVLALNASYAPNANLKSVQMAQDFYDLSSETLTGETFNFDQLRGKRVLIVNTASKCGYTPQYKQLQELHETYGGPSFVVIGFPSNNFGRQEPGSNEEIKEFCQKNFGVDFLMMAKTPVKGKEQHPVYQWLTQQEKNGVSDAKVSWNFNKFLVDEKGRWVAHYSSSVGPLDEKIIAFARGEG